MTRIAWLPEPPKHTQKAAFFDAVADVAGGGVPLSLSAMRLQSFPESAARAQDCLARAKRVPKSAFGRAAKLRFLQARYNWARNWFATHPGHTALCWQGLTGTRRAVMLGARDAGASTLFAELSPLPGYLTLDPKGVNAEGSVPQDPSAYDDVTADATLLQRLQTQFVARTPRRSDVGQIKGAAPDTPYLFVPLQVPDDSQIVLFAGWVGSVAGFIAALATAARSLPQGWHLRIKEHPSAKRSFASQIDAAIAAGAPMVRDNQTDSFELIAQSQGVVTVNSAMGLQAMFWDKPVITTGESFYGMPGVATHASGPEALEAAMVSAAFDAALRGRFLTWLATRYYIPETTDGFDAARIAARLSGDI